MSSEETQDAPSATSRSIVFDDIPPRQFTPKAPPLWTTRPHLGASAEKCLKTTLRGHTGHLLNQRPKVILVGDSGVGKTSLLTHYLAGESGEQSSTIGFDFQMVRVSLFQNQYPYKVAFYDTAGQERFKSITVSYMRQTHVVLAVFDATNRTSLQHTHRWIAQVRDINPPGNQLAIFLVATKIDLVESGPSYQSLHRAATEAAQALGAELWEVSGLTGDHVQGLIERAAVVACLEAVRASDTKLTVLETTGSELSVFAEPEPNEASCCFS